MPDCRNPPGLALGRGRHCAFAPPPGRGSRRCATPSSSCTARWAPARPPSCATCCRRWACRAASRARPTRWSSPTNCPPATALAIWHFDFYRFNDPREWEDAGFRDIFASPGLKLAEWPEKAAGMLPVADLRPAHRRAGRRARARCADRHTPHRGSPAGRAAWLPDAMNAAPRPCCRWAAWCCCWARRDRTGATIVAVRVWPAQDYSRVTIESDAGAQDQPAVRGKPAAPGGGHRRHRAQARRCANWWPRCRPTTRTSPASVSASSAPAWCAWCIDLKQPVRAAGVHLRRWPPTSTAWCSTCTPSRRPTRWRR
jgi:hypothetical protein